MKWQQLLLLVAVLAAGCGEIKHSSQSVQPLNEQLIAGVGDSILEIEMRESLPNVAGKADLFGRTRPTGRITIIYLGIEQRRAAFERQTVRLLSNATTMNSSPVVIPQSSTTTYSGSTNIYGASPSGAFSGSALSSGTATTTAPPIVLPPSGSQTQVISNDRIRYFLDLRQNPKLIVEGHEVVIEEATASSVKYRVKNLY